MRSSEPIFTVEGNDVTVYPSREHAGRSLEAYDIEAGSIRVFRGDGVELRPRLHGRRVIVTDEEEGQRPGILADALRRYLHSLPTARRTMDDAATERAPLSDLVEEILRVENT